MIDAIRLENLGKPTITLVQDRFEKAARLHAKAGGLPEIALMVEPAPGDGSSIQHDVEGLVADNIPTIVAALSAGIERA